jgi:phosphate uptake regulator
VERHFKLELDEQKQQLLWMGGLAERAVHQAKHAVLVCDEKATQDFLGNEDAINKLQIKIDERAV